MAFQRSSMIRAATLRSTAFRLANAFSIGLKSGEYGGGKRNRAPVAVNAGAPMRCQIVHHGDIALPERRDQHLLDIGQEGIAVHRAIEDHQRGHATQPQCAGEGCCFPVAMRDRSAASLSSFSAAAQPGHLGGRPCLVDEDQMLGIEVRLRVEPGLAPRGDVGPFLPAGVRRFFDGHRVAIQKAPHRDGRKRGAMFTAQHLGQFDERYVHLGLDRGQNNVTIRLDAL